MLKLSPKCFAPTAPQSVSQFQDVVGESIWALTPPQTPPQTPPNPSPPLPNPLLVGEGKGINLLGERGFPAPPSLAGKGAGGLG